MTEKKMDEVEELKEFIVAQYLSEFNQHDAHRLADSLINAGYTRPPQQPKVMSLEDTYKTISAMPAQQPDDEAQWCIDRLNESVLEVHDNGKESEFFQRASVHLNVIRRTLAILAKRKESHDKTN